MSDVDKLQLAEEAAAQRAEDAERGRREAQAAELREQPLRGTATKRLRVHELTLGQVHPGDNIRTDLPEIQELALSIRELGLLTPLIVRPWQPDATADGPLPRGADPDVEHYRLVAGHRRYAALRALVDAGVDGYDTVRCEVRDDLSQAEAYALMLTENVQRVPLEPVQAARALRLLLDLNEGMSAATLARWLGLRPAWAQLHLKLLDLPQQVIDRVEAGDLSVTIADLLRRGQAAGRIDEGTMIDLAAKAAAGQITSTQVRAEAGPPRAPNTVAPTTVAMGADGRPMAPRTTDARFDRTDASPRDERGDRERREVPRHALPDSPDPGLYRMPGDGATLRPGRVVDGETVEERMVRYLLARALREWASDEYLDGIGIDRVQCDAYAEALADAERVDALRDLSMALMTAEEASAGAHATSGSAKPAPALVV